MPTGEPLGGEFQAYGYRLRGHKVKPKDFWKKEAGIQIGVGGGSTLYKRMKCRTTDFINSGILG